MNIAFIFLIVSLIIEKVDLNSDLYSVTSLFSMHRDSSLRRNIEITFLATCLWVWTQWFTVVRPLLGGAIGSTVFEGETTHSEFNNYVDSSVFAQIVKE